MNIYCQCKQCGCSFPRRVGNKYVCTDCQAALNRTLKLRWQARHQRDRGQEWDEGPAVIEALAKRDHAWIARRIEGVA